MFYDFHTHTSLSDGILSPMEIIRYAVINNYSAIGLTDHVALGSLARVIKEVSEDCALARAHWNILAIPGVELTHLPPEAIDKAAQRAKELGAWLVIIHGETTSEPVIKGTNLAAIQSQYVDILAHPGFITLEEATLASQNGTFIELSARKNHSSANNHIASIAKKTGAMLLINSDAHDSSDLLTSSVIDAIIHNTALDEQRQQILIENPTLLIKELTKNHPPRDELSPEIKPAQF